MPLANPGYRDKIQRELHRVNSQENTKAMSQKTPQPIGNLPFKQPPSSETITRHQQVHLPDISNGSHSSQTGNSAKKARHHAGILSPHS